MQAIIAILHKLWLSIIRVFRLLLTPIGNTIESGFGEYFRDFNVRHRVSEDFYLVPRFFKCLFQYIWSIKTHQFQNWYRFEEQVSKNKNRYAISYTKPLQIKGEYQLELYTYGELYNMVLRLSHILKENYNVNPGDHIAVDCTNKPLFVFLWLALWNIGAIPAFMNYNSIGEPLVHSLKVSQVSQVFIDPQASEPIKQTEREIKEELPGLFLHYLDEDELISKIKSNKAPMFLQSKELRSPKELTDFKPSMFIFTSGTTGLPKSAIMSWRKSAFGSDIFGYVFHMTHKSCVFTAMPLFHSTANLLGACAILNHGGCLAISHKFSASNFWKEVCLHEATHVQYVGEICRYLLHSPVTDYERNHKATIAYGNGLRPEIWQDFKKRFNIPIIGEFYAATEAPFATTNYQKDNSFGVGACRNYGTFVQWFLQFQQTLVKVDPLDDTTLYRNSRGFCEVPNNGEPGEMLMRIFFPKKPETSFQGYLGNEKATRSKVVRNVFRQGDAWYRCNDLLRTDEYGMWYFLDRTGDTFRWKSENVSTTEVEDQIVASNKSNIEQVVVVGIKIPGYEGRAGFAIIKLKNKKLDDTQKEIFLNHCLESLNKSLPKYALPIIVKFVDEMATTESHKIMKKVYKDQVLPKGADGNDKLFWLSNGKNYKMLTESDWNSIVKQQLKL